MANYRSAKATRSHSCIVCGTHFVSNRITAKFCSDKCRQADYRKRKEAKDLSRKLQMRLPFDMFDPINFD